MDIYNYLIAMNTLQKIDFKKELLRKCISIIKERIAASHQSMESAQVAANNEEKSSAGDKYETGRAMNHLDKDMYTKQLVLNRKDLQILLAVNCSKIFEVATAGSFVRCTGCSFFIAAGLGKISVENELIFLISPYAPIARLLHNKKAGDAILFNNKDLIILEVY